MPKAHRLERPRAPGAEVSRGAAQIISDGRGRARRGQSAMSKDNRTWLEKQQEHKRLLANCGEELAVLQQRIEASDQRVAELQARIQAQKQEYTCRLFHWILDRQLRKLDRQRQHAARMLDEVARLEQARHEFEQELEKPPPVRLRRVRVVTVSAETVFFLLALSLFGWLVSQWLLRH